MKEFDWVRLIVEKEKYAQEGVHKGMVGCIIYDKSYNGEWLVGFDIEGATLEDLKVVELSVHESDMELE